MKLKLKLLHQLVGLLLLIGVLPLLIVSLLMIGIARNQVETTVEHVHRLEADAAASRVRDFMVRSQDRLVADFETSIESMEDAYIDDWLTYVLGKQHNIFTFRVIGLHDSTGEALAPPSRLPAESIPEEHRRHYLVTDDDIEIFSRKVPLRDALKQRTPQYSDVYFCERRREALQAIAIPVLDNLGQLKWIVTGEISLRDVQRMVSDVTIGNVGFAYLVDGRGVAVAHPKYDLVRERADLARYPIVASALESLRPKTVSFVENDGVQQLGAHAPVLWCDWQLAVQQPAADAYSPVRAMKMRALYVLLVALAASLACGVLYVRSLVKPLRQVVEGMREIVEGNFDRRLKVRTRDEIGELAGAFNVMGRMLQKYRTEIEKWNRELRARVEAKTEALQSAQNQLIHSAKMSALGQLGAGVAHELNNPLTGIVGQAALLRRRLEKLELNEPERKKLVGYVEHVHSESLRCREIISALLNFSTTPGGGAEELDFNESVVRLLALVQSNAKAANVIIEEELAPDLPRIRANEPQVQQAVMHVITNALQAMPAGGRVTVRTHATEEGVAISVEDTGRGIEAEHVNRIFEPFFTTKDVWESTGLGLSVCYSIVESHGGRIDVQSVPGKGSTFTLRFPTRPPDHRESTGPGGEPVGLARRRPVGASS